MGSKSWPIAAGLVVLAACGKTASNEEEAGAAADSTSGSGGAGSSGISGGVGGGTATTALTTQGLTTGGSACSFPQAGNCGGECLDLRSSREHCGSCGNVCPEDQDCILSRCEPPITCERSPTQYDASDMDPSGGTALDDGWLLAFGDTLSLEHAFADARGVLLLTARGLDGEPRPYVSVTIGEHSFVPLLLRSASHAVYALEFDGLGANGIVSITPTTTDGTQYAGAVIQRVEIMDCYSMYAQCSGRGYYLSELPACAPPVCSEPDDCTRDLPGPPFLGSCDAGICAFPSCTEPTASGLPIYEEYASPENGVRCFTYADLKDPLRNPRATSLEADPQNLECPAIEALTWQVDPFHGESTCVEAPICGPNTPEQLGFEPKANECCYMIASLCGV